MFVISSAARKASIARRGDEDERVSCKSESACSNPSDIMGCCSCIYVGCVYLRESARVCVCVRVCGV